MTFLRFLMLSLLLSFSFNVTCFSFAETSIPSSLAANSTTSLKSSDSLTKILKLTPEQRSEIDAIRKTFDFRYHTDLERYQAKVQAFFKLKQQSINKDINSQRKSLHQDTIAIKALYQQLDEQIMNVLTIKQAKRFKRIRRQWRHERFPNGIL